MKEQLDVLDDVASWAPAFEIAFDTTPIGMALLDLDGRMVRANAALGEMLGYTPNELCRLGWSGLLKGADLRGEAACRAALAAGSASEQCELHCRHRSGRPVWIGLTRVLAPGADGRPAYFVDQVQDFSERQRAEKEIVLLNNVLEQRIRRRTAELEESNEDLRDFAYSLAHDLRGPLASIDGFSAQLERLLAERLDPRCAHYLRRVRAGVQQMGELTDGLLALADLARTELQHQGVDLSEIAASILERLRESEPERSVAVHVAPTPPAQGDRRLLTNVMENLLGNAWKFTGRTPDATIAFGGASRPGGQVCYEVTDNGAGFDPAFVSQLFTPFQRLHKATEFAGNGIGLAMVRKIVVRHGGQVWAESQPGEGARFCFTLREQPAAAPSASAGP
ncbi:ATP-binding protein [Ramlibacter sp.]|uniref:sensor histidine kinase n=1 Tax=Ramlibacter sp. TaxID=1917967 RepID=UPI001805A1BF|nr:ATP-binding protein [Ramlibacter sp.]MBA2674943.1 PAS domain S-box protein [Ramlibacter sp.]